MKLKLFFVTAFSALIVVSCSNQQKEDSPTVSGQQNTTESNSAAAANALPSFNVHDVKGNVVNLQNLKGKKLFVNLWASWCPPCKREMPSIEKLYQSIDTAKVAFLLVSLDDQFEKAKNYVNSKKLKLPIYYPAQVLPDLFNVQGIPATFIFNEKAELIKRIDGGEDYNTVEYKTLLQ
jgi:thiol-disulfide isomerase/thioredoxin